MLHACRLIWNKYEQVKRSQQDDASFELAYYVHMMLDMSISMCVLNEVGEGLGESESVNS